MHSYPWYITDWRESDSVLAMTAEQRDVYRNLLDMCWRDGSLPVNERALQKMSLADDGEWGRSWPTVRSMFVERDGRLWNEKVNEKRPNVSRMKGIRSDSASHASRMRWAMRDGCATDAPRINDASDSQCERNADLCLTLTPSLTPTLAKNTNTPPTPPDGGDECEQNASDPPTPEQPAKAQASGRASDAVRTIWFEEEFWPIVWSKIGKGSARKSFFAKARDRPMAERIIEAAKQQGPGILDRARFGRITPIHPATWLNQERYDDDPQALSDRDDNSGFTYEILGGLQR